MRKLDDNALIDLEARLDYRFASKFWLRRAITHASSPLASTNGTFQRLEFLGDRVLGLVIAEMLSTAFPKANEGELSRRLNRLVCKPACALVSDKLAILTFVQLGSQKVIASRRARDALMGDVCEAIIGAIYRDGGLSPARHFIARHWRDRITQSGQARDPKTALQEWAQGNGLDPPSYRVVMREGPDHAPRFTVAASLEGLAEETGTGGSKREAEQTAASAVLIREGVWPSYPPYAPSSTEDHPTSARPVDTEGATHVPKP